MKTKQSEFFVDKLIKLSSKKTALELMYLGQDLSAKVGFDFDNIDIVMEKVKEEFIELNEAFNNKNNDYEHFLEELSDCFFALVNLARHAKAEPEKLAKKNAEKYILRCLYIEKKLKETKKTWTDLTYSEIATLWKEAKLKKVDRVKFQ
jgi:tetrapyrrole methylase family protein/MazG family protein